MNQRFVLPIAILFLGNTFTSGQEPNNEELLQKPQWQRLLQGDDAKKAADLEKKRDDAAGKHDFETAIRASTELYELRRCFQGANHYQTIDEKWLSTKLTKLSALPAAGRAEWRDAHQGATKAHQLEQKGNYREALPARQSWAQLCQKVLGEEHPDTALGYNNAALNLHAQGKYAEAEPLCKKALAIWQKSLGEEHPKTATGYNNAALNLNAQGKYAEAEPLYKKALVIWQKSLGEEHPNTATSYGNVAANLYSQGRYAEAGPLFKKALSVRQKALGEGHHNTATSYNNLAANLNAQGKYAEGEALYKMALAIRQKVLGEEHPDTARSYGSLALNLNAQGKYAEAESLLKKALAITQTVLGEEYPDTATSYSIVAANLNAQGRYTEAEPLYKKALAITLKALGEEHRYTAAGYNNVAFNLSDQGKYSEAEPLCKKAMAIWQKALGEEHPDTALSYNNVAANLNAQGKCAEAEPLYKKALAIWQKSLGEGHHNTATSYNNVALNLNSQGRFDESLKFLNKCCFSFESSRLVAAGRGTDRSSLSGGGNPYPMLAATQARLKSPREAFAALETKFDEFMASLNRGGDWSELPGTRLELKTLNELFADKATILADHAASESQVEALRLDGTLGKFRYLHFASHGEANNVRSFDSALILAQDDPKKQGFAPTDAPWINGRLTAREVLDHWKLDAELVTLSACQTALGREGGGDGLLGFAQAFLLAGSRSVCLSLWEVDDRATALLMDRFYRNLLGKREGLTKPMHKADALAEAKKWLRNLTQDEVAQRLAGLTEGVARGKGQKAVAIAAPEVSPKADLKQVKPFDHPRYWAAFILIGDPS